jgi:hypothetical protein
MNLCPKDKNANDGILTDELSQRLEEEAQQQH